MDDWMIGRLDDWTIEDWKIGRFKIQVTISAKLAAESDNWGSATFIVAPPFYQYNIARAFCWTAMLLYLGMYAAPESIRAPAVRIPVRDGSIQLVSASSIIIMMGRGRRVDWNGSWWTMNNEQRTSSLSLPAAFFLWVNPYTHIPRYNDWLLAVEQDKTINHLWTCPCPSDQLNVWYTTYMLHIYPQFFW